MFTTPAGESASFSGLAVRLISIESTEVMEKPSNEVAREAEPPPRLASALAVRIPSNATPTY